ncbi:MAG: pyridoxamine 5'-phosphate oxidase family protein [Phycisphaeraceae bacterium]
MTDLSIDQQIGTFLAVCRTASLATVDAQGSPCNANVQYASDDAWRIVWVSSESSAHSVNLSEDPQAALTVYAHMDSPELIHGLQLRGKVRLLDGDDAEAALSLYTAKYPFTAERPYRDAVLKQRFYRFTAAWLRWIDNRRGFGFKRELNL